MTLSSNVTLSSSHLQNVFVLSLIHIYYKKIIKIIGQYDSWEGDTYCPAEIGLKNTYKYRNVIKVNEADDQTYMSPF